jgi:hypothetical protein
MHNVDFSRKKTEEHETGGTFIRHGSNEKYVTQLSRKLRREEGTPESLIFMELKLK